MAPYCSLPVYRDVYRLILLLFEHKRPGDAEAGPAARRSGGSAEDAPVVAVQG